MVADAVYESVRVSLALINIMLHASGIYLLYCVRSKLKECERIQYIYVINLSVTELFVNSVILVLNIIQVIGYSSFSFFSSFLRSA